MFAPSMALFQDGSHKFTGHRRVSLAKWVLWRGAQEGGGGMEGGGGGGGGRGGMRRKRHQTRSKIINRLSAEH